MRYIVIKLLLFVSFLLQGCGGENSYESVDGLAVPIKSIYSTIQEDANATYSIALEAEALVDDSNSSLENFEALREKTQALILAYKRVEALYIAQKLESSMTDVPVYVEALSAGDLERKAPILNELATILNPSNTTAIESALYKNAYKSITGLLYALYENQESSAAIFAKMDARRVSAIKIMLRNIVEQLESIALFYANNSSFLENSEASSILLNQLAISSNRLKEWRLGDPGGLTQKYLGDANALRFEYYSSQTSLDAIKAILQAHKSISENGLDKIASSADASSEADAIKEHIDSLLALCESFGAPIEADANDEKVAQLYNGAYILQTHYTALINALNFTQDIIEADGD